MKCDEICKFERNEEFINTLLSLSLHFLTMIILGKGKGTKQMIYKVMGSAEDGLLLNELSLHFQRPLLHIQLQPEM